MIRITLAQDRIPKMVRDECQQQAFRRRPGQGGADRCGSPGLEIGEIGGKRAQRVVAHALVDEMAQRLDILVGEQLSEFVAALHRQHGGNRVELFGAALDCGE